MSQKTSNARPTPMTAKAASRIQSATALKHGGVVPRGSFSTRAQSAAVANQASKGTGRK